MKAQLRLQEKAPANARALVEYDCDPALRPGGMNNTLRSVQPRTGRGRYPGPRGWLEPYSTHLPATSTAKSRSKIPGWYCSAPRIISRTHRSQSRPQTAAFEQSKYPGCVAALPGGGQRRGVSRPVSKAARQPRGSSKSGIKLRRFRKSTGRFNTRIDGIAVPL